MRKWIAVLLYALIVVGVYAVMPPPAGAYSCSHYICLNEGCINGVSWAWVLEYVPNSPKYNTFEKNYKCDTNFGAGFWNCYENKTGCSGLTSTPGGLPCDQDNGYLYHLDEAGFVTIFETNAKEADEIIAFIEKSDLAHAKAKYRVHAVTLSKDFNAYRESNDLFFID